MLAAPSGVGAAARPPRPGVPRLLVKGRDIIAPDGEPIRLRGFNVLWWASPDAQAADDIREIGANCVRYMFGYKPTGRFDPKRIEFLARHVRTFTSRGLWVFVTVHRFERKAGTEGNERWQRPWDSPPLRREFLDMWTHVVELLKNEPFVAAWEPLNEPHDVDAEVLMKWYGEVVAHFRTLDPNTAVVLEGKDWSNPWSMGEYLKLPESDARPRREPNVIYSFHMYSPHDFTHQKPDRPTEYPGRWGRQYLVEQMRPAVEFRDRFNVPVWCGEWGCITRARGCERWLADVASVLEEHSLHWTHWAWVVKAEPVNDTFDINKHKTGIHSVLAEVFRETRAAEAGAGEAGE